MTLTELRYIVAVARERHFGRAAEKCFVSQPTLSVAVRKLEEELGVTLFERSPGEVRVTPTGRRIVQQAQRTLEEAMAIREIAQGGRDQLAAPLRIGAIYTVGPYLLPELIPALRERAPNMPVLIEENYTRVLSERLRQGELDVIVISLPFEEPGVATEPVYEEPFVIVLPSSHPWNQRVEIQASELEQENVLLLGPGHCFRDQVLEACPGCDRRSSSEENPQSNLEGSSLETIRHMVASGIGITVLPCSAAGAGRYSQRLITLRRFVPPVPVRSVALAWRKSFPRAEAITVLRRAVMACELTCVRKIEVSDDVARTA